MVYTVSSIRKVVLLLSFVLFCVTSQAQLLTPEQAAQASQEQCQKGCVVLSRDELLMLKMDIEQSMQKAAQEGFEQGLKEGLKSARSNPRICPRNI